MQSVQVVHSVLYAPRSGLIAQVERGARKEAEAAFLAEEVAAILRQAKSRDSLGVFNAPASPGSAAAAGDSGTKPKFWWALL
jgi:hypothetical protein